MFLQQTIKISVLIFSLSIIFGCSKPETEQKEAMSSPVISGYLYGAN